MVVYPRRREQPRCPSGKVIYESVEKAEAATAIMQIRHGAQLRVYGCPTCGFYHTTRQLDRAGCYQQLDIKGELLKAVESQAATVVDRLPRGASRYSYNGYVFLYSPNGRSPITIERSPAPTDVLLEAVQAGRARLIEKQSNSVRVFEYEVDGNLYTFTYNKSCKKVTIDSKRAVQSDQLSNHVRN